jgi:predicted phosphate transport protein (TIGR00153 family)
VSAILKISKVIENQIDEFLDLVSESGMLFKRAIENYLNGDMEQFSIRLQRVIEYERKADELRTDIEKQLALRTLIPENRGDVLSLLENTDNVIDNIKKTLQIFAIETPEIPKKYNDLFNELTDTTIQSAEWLIKSVRAFFKDFMTVNDHIHKVSFYEKETDDIAFKLKKQIFSDDIDLSLKMHLRYFVSNIESISDYAESVSDRLAIYTINRMI